MEKFSSAEGAQPPNLYKIEFLIYLYIKDDFCAKFGYRLEILFKISYFPRIFEKIWNFPSPPNPQKDIFNISVKINPQNRPLNPWSYKFSSCFEIFLKNGDSQEAWILSEFFRDFIFLRNSFNFWKVYPTRERPPSLLSWLPEKSSCYSTDQGI